jgi:hypothetical protein
VKTDYAQRYDDKKVFQGAPRRRHWPPTPETRRRGGGPHPRFLGLVVLPLVIRALHGEKLKVLHAEIEPHMARRVAFFLAVCRHAASRELADPAR